MDFELSEEQKMLASTGRDFIKQCLPMSLIRKMEQDLVGFSSEVWNGMASLGWHGVMAPEEFGGVGGNFLDLIILLQELGRSCYQGPFLSNSLCAMAVLAWGSSEQKKAILPGIVCGKSIIVLALDEPSSGINGERIGTKARRTEGGWKISGTKLFVPYAHVATDLMCVARAEEGLALFVVDAKSRGIGVTPLETVAGDRQCAVRFTQVEVGQENVLGDPGQGKGMVEQMRRWGALAQSAVICGAIDHVLEMSVAYAKQRVQFGQLIGAFQAIQHKCADMLADVEAARNLTYQAGWKASNGLEAKLDIAMAKSRASDASRRVCLLGHAIHGGVGLTTDHDMQILFRQAKGMELAFGNADYHREMIAQHMGL